MRPHTHSRGFTMTEVLVTLTIIAVIAALAVPVGISIRGKAHRAQCLGNLRQLGTAMESWLQDNGSTMPQWQAGRASKMDQGPVLETELLPYFGNPETCHCPADSKEFEKSGSSYLWVTAQNGRNRHDLVFFGSEGEPRRVPLIIDKEGWHSGEPSVNFLYADMSASTKVHFGVNE